MRSSLEKNNQHVLVFLLCPVPQGSIHWMISATGTRVRIPHYFKHINRAYLSADSIYMAGDEGFEPRSVGAELHG